LPSQDCADISRTPIVNLDYLLEILLFWGQIPIFPILQVYFPQFIALFSKAHHFSIPVQLCFQLLLSTFARFD
jgi:hypothetical protein